MQRFALCTHFHCGPHELEEWGNGDLEDFIVILEEINEKAARDRKAAERARR